MENQNTSFSYTYYAKEQREVEKITNKYRPSESKLETLKRLDRNVTLPGKITSLSVGIVGTLTFGLGLCFCLGALSLDGIDNMLLGVILAAIGLVIAAPAYPIYSAITKRQKEKLTPEILRLSGEILGK